MQKQLHINPDKGSSWMASTVTQYYPPDEEGYSIPTRTLKTSDLSPGDLAAFGTVVAYFVATGAGEWDATKVIVEPASPAIVTPAVVDEETGEVTAPAVTRQALHLAVTVKRTAAPYGEKTDTLSTEDLPDPVRLAAISVWNSLTD